MNAFARQVLVTVIAACSTLPLAAQMGDQRDSPGMEQKPPNPEFIRPAPVLSPQEALQTFKLQPGFRIELVASEPLIHEPVALDFDPDGRIWVIEMRSYMPDIDGKGENQRINRVVVLEDTNKDGKMDKSTVYMEGLGLPRTIKVLRDGVLIGDPPNLWFTRDTDGDGKADEKTAIATDFSLPERNPEIGANALIWGLDNWLVGSGYGRRWRLQDGKWISSPVTLRGQWGQGMDDWGRLYTNSNEDHFRADLIPPHYPARNPNLVLSPRAGSPTSGVNYQVNSVQTVWPARPNPGVNRGYWEGRLRPDGSMRNFDAACGPMIYRGDNFPAEFNGNYFNAEPAGNLVRRSIITEEDGILRGRNAYDGTEFLRSTDERFRPANVYTAPDGTLYVVDLYRGILQHRQYMTSFLRRQILERGLDKGLGYGRIYRVVHDGKPVGPVPALSRATPAELVATLSHPNGWWRDTAQRLLVEAGDKSVVPKLRDVALARDAGEIVRLKALWTMEGLGAIEPGILAPLLDDPAVKIRTTAIRLSEPFLAARQAGLTEQVLKHSSDPAREVRVQLALSVAEAPPAVREATLAGLLRRDASAPFLAASAVSSLAGRELAFLESLVSSPEWREAGEGYAQVLHLLAAAVAEGAQSAEVKRLFALAGGEGSPLWQRRAVLRGIAMSGLRHVDAMPTAMAAAAKSADPEIAESAGEMMTRLTWPGKHDAAPPLTAAEQVLFEKGRVAYSTICVACHQPDGRGLPGVAAPLVNSPWVLGSDEFLARIVLKGKVGKTNVTMPPLEMLGSETLAAALTFIRRSWGHEAPAVSPATVNVMREYIILRSEPYTETELEGMKAKTGAQR